MSISNQSKHNRRYTTDTYIAAVKEIGKNAERYDYSKTVFVRIKDKITVYCKRCERQFTQSASTHLHLKTQCPCYSNQDKKPAYYLEIAQRLAKTRGGKLISTNYVNSKTNLEWECKCGCRFRNLLSNIERQNQWCPACYKQSRGVKRRKGQEDFLRELRVVHGEKYGYDAVQYRGVENKILLYCKSCRHEFSILARTALNGSGCKQCAKKSIGNKNRKYRLADMHQLATQYGGRLLSISYNRVDRALTWKCSKGHIFEKSPRQIMSKHTWCYECNVTHKRGEKIVRLYLERLFGKTFTSVRPKWLVYEKGFPLELDGFNAELAIAFEHQGAQHDTYVSHFHRTEVAFRNRKKADAFKKRECKRRGVKLLVIPELFNKLQPAELPAFINCQLVELGIRKPPIPTSIDDIVRDYYAEYDYLSYSEAKVVLAKYGFKYKREFRKAYDSGQIPNNVPRDPREYYLKTKNWESWYDFLGDAYVGDKSETWMSFAEARQMVHSLALRSNAEWNRLVKSGELPNRVPADPKRVYSRSGDWVSMADWLGSESVQVGTKKAVVVFDKEGNRVHEFESAAAASRATGVNFSDISGCCRGIREHACGLRFQFAKQAAKRLSPLWRVLHRNQSVSQYSGEGKLIRTFPTARLAAQSIGVSRSAIQMCCTGRTKLSGGFQWRYGSEEKMPVRT